MSKPRTFIVKDDMAKARVLRGIQAAELKNAAGQWLLVTISRKKPRRSLSQNALYWAWLTIVADHTGGDNEDVHLAFRAKFLGCKMIAGQAVPNSTAAQETMAFAEYLKKVEAYCATELGLALPQPNDPEAWEAFQQAHAA